MTVLYAADHKNACNTEKRSFYLPILSSFGHDIICHALYRPIFWKDYSLGFQNIYLCGFCQWYSNIRKFRSQWAMRYIPFNDLISMRASSIFDLELLTWQEIIGKMYFSLSWDMAWSNKSQTESTLSNEEGNFVSLQYILSYMVFVTSSGLEKNRYK